MSHTFTAKQTDYWKQQAYALTVSYTHLRAHET